MSNRDDFDRFAALILDQLYEAFPQEVFLDLDEHQPDAETNTVLNFYHTAKFLADEQFIRYHSVSATGKLVMQAGLTAKGLAVLNKVPEVLSSKAPLGQQVGTALKAGAKETIKMVVGEIVKAGTTVALGHAGISSPVT